MILMRTAARILRNRCVLALGALVVIVGGAQNVSLAAIPAAYYSEPELSYSCLVKYVSISDFTPYKNLILGVARANSIEIWGHSYRNIMWNFGARSKRANCQPSHMFICQVFKIGAPIADYTQSPNPKFVSGRLPAVFESNGSHWVFRMWPKHRRGFHVYVRPQLTLGAFASNAIGVNSGIGGPNGEPKSKNQQSYADTANVKLPFSDNNDVSGRICHPLLCNKIILFTLLGCLTAGAASWFGANLAFDGRRRWQRISGWCLFPLGAFSAVFFWGWGLSGYPLAFIDRGTRFLNILLG